MIITQVLDQNRKRYGDEISLIEVNPEAREKDAALWKEYDLVETGREDHYRRAMTWLEFDQKANRFANLLQSRGIGPGRKVAILLMNCLEWLPIYFGILKSGAVVVPLNFRYSAEEIRYCLELSESDAIVFGPEFVERMALAAPKLAPEATPSVSGVARGLAKRLWNTQPETDSPAPTSAANNTRGSRIDHRTALACAPTSRPSSSETRSRTGTFIRPTHRHTSAHRTGAIRNTTSCHRRRLPGIGCFFMLPPEKQKDRIPEQDTACPPMHARRKNASLSPQGRNVDHSRILASGSGGC